MKVFSLPSTDLLFSQNNDDDRWNICTSKLSDLAILEGANRSHNLDYGQYWLKDELGNNTDYNATQLNGKIEYVKKNRTDICCRPIIEDESLNQLPSDMILFKSDEQIIIGEYPIGKVSKHLEEELSILLSTKEIPKTGKKYLLGVDYDEQKKKYAIDFREEYYYRGKKYIYLENSSNRLNKVWLEVEPVYFSRKRDVWLANDCLFSGIPYNFRGIKEGAQPFIEQYLNTCFLESIIPSGLEKIKRDHPSQIDILCAISFLSNVSVEFYAKTRAKFEAFGEEYGTFFDSEWIGGDFKRAEIVKNIKSKKI